MLHTVRTFRLSPEPPLFLTISTSHSPPHFDIFLFRPTSSSAICFPSEIRSFAIVSTSFPTSMAASSVHFKRLVAAPRLTAVGRAVYKNSKIGIRCVLRVSGDLRKSGTGDASSAQERWAEKESAAKEAIAGAPRI